MVNSLKHFVRVASILDKMRNRDIFVRVVKGKNEGTVGRIVYIERIHYERHIYHLEIDGKIHKFCGSLLEETDITQTTMASNNHYVRVFRDFNDRPIELGQCVIFMRCTKGKSTQEMVMGSVQQVDMLGVHVVPFAINGKYAIGHKIFRSTKTETMMIVDADTQNAVFVNKLSAPDITEMKKAA